MYIYDISRLRVKVEVFHPELLIKYKG
jgi:hypothetical protein